MRGSCCWVRRNNQGRGVLIFRWRRCEGFGSQLQSLGVSLLLGRDQTRERGHGEDDGWMSGRRTRAELSPRRVRQGVVSAQSDHDDDQEPAEDDESRAVDRSLARERHPHR